MIPNLSNTVRRFEETMQFQLVKKTINEGDLDETSKIPVPLWFEGTLQPLHSRELMVKSEGERKFKWWTLFTDLELTVDSIVKDPNGLNYRVMSSTDWTDSGYRQYQLIQGPPL